MDLYEGLVQLGLTNLKQDDLPEVMSTWELSAFCERNGLTYIGFGGSFKLPEALPVVAIYHSEGEEVDAGIYTTMRDVDLNRLSGLIYKADA